MELSTAGALFHTHRSDANQALGKVLFERIQGITKLAGPSLKLNLYLSKHFDNPTIKRWSIENLRSETFALDRLIHMARHLDLVDADLEQEIQRVLASDKEQSVIGA